MKKLLIFMLVLGLTSVSQGALAWLQVDAASLPLPPVGVAKNIQIDVVADYAASGYNLDVALSSDPFGRVATIGGGLVPDGIGLSPEVLAGAGLTVTAPGYAINNTQAGVGVLFDISAAGLGAIPAGNVIASFKYILQAGWGAGGPITISMAAPGTQIVDDLGMVYFAAQSWVSPSVPPPAWTPIGSVTIIPEPATIALLGLGGLLLRRRK